MSIQAVSYVLQTSKTRLWDRLVLISLANHANEEAVTWPKVPTIVHESGSGRRTVQRSLRRLQEMGEIIPLDGNHSGGRISTRYFMSGYDTWRQNVGAPTLKPSGKREEIARIAYENALKRYKNPPQPRQPDAPGAPRQTPQGRQSLTPQGRQPDTQPRQPDAPGAPRETPQGRHPWRGRGATLGALSVIEPSGNLENGNPPAGAALPSEGAPAYPKGAAAEIAATISAVASGRQLPEWVGADYRPDDADPTMDQIREADRQKRALEARLKDGLQPAEGVR